MTDFNTRSEMADMTNTPQTKRQGFVKYLDQAVTRCAALMFDTIQFFQIPPQRCLYPEVVG